MSIQPSDDPAMSHAAGRDEAAEGLGELEPSLAEGGTDTAGEESERPSTADIPAAAPGSGSGDTGGRATGGMGGTASGSDLSHPLG